VSVSFFVVPTFGVRTTTISCRVSGLFRELFRLQPFVYPIWAQLQDLLRENSFSNDEATAQVLAMVRHVSARTHKFLEFDIDEIEAIGDGRDITSIMGRALLAAAKREGDPRWALRSVVNHSGYSGITGAIIGALVGVRVGVAGLPQDWIEALDLGDLVEEVAQDVYWHFPRRNPYDEDEKQGWNRRYTRRA
jgi:ADP-ribosylglycohydrolase